MTKGQIVLAVIVQAGFISITAFFFFAKQSLAPEFKEMISLIVGAWIVNSTTIVNWFFGSSKGSSDKTLMLTKKEP